jgi:hypothetical protein
MATEGRAGGGKTGGRIKGTPNKLTGDVKGMILAALDAAGGADYLHKQASKNPVAFMVLVGKVLPMQIAGSLAITIETGVPREHDTTEASDQD